MAVGKGREKGRIDDVYRGKGSLLSMINVFAICNVRDVLIIKSKNGGEADGCRFVFICPCPTSELVAQCIVVVVC